MQSVGDKDSDIISSILSYVLTLIYFDTFCVNCNKGARRVFGLSLVLILQGTQFEVGHDLIDHVYCINTSMPEHEATPIVT